MPSKTPVGRYLEQFHEGARPTHTVLEDSPETLSKFGNLQQHLWKWHDKRKHQDGFAVCAPCAVVQLFLREHPKVLENL